MINTELHNLLAAWARLGMEIDVDPASQTPDVEFLLLDTARLLPEMARLLPISVTWIALCEQLIARHRLAVLASTIPDVEQSACLGLMLDFARAKTHTRHLTLPIGACRPLHRPAPLLRIERGPEYMELAELEASPISRRWGLLAPEPDLKDDAIRPMEWIAAANPDLRIRAMLSGTLSASLMAALSADSSIGVSESALARACQTTRRSIRRSLDQLELSGLVRREQHGRSVRVRPCKVQIKIG